MKQKNFLITLLVMAMPLSILAQDAIKINAILKAMKFTGNTTIVSEAQNEASHVLEYEIEF